MIIEEIENDEASVIRPIDMAKVIADTSPGDMLLLMIALSQVPQPSKPSDSLTYSVLVRGFPTWFDANYQELVNLYDAESREVLDTLEDFAVELFFEIQLTNE